MGNDLSVLSGAGAESFLYLDEDEDIQTPRAVPPIDIDDQGAVLDEMSYDSNITSEDYLEDLDDSTGDQNPTYGDIELSGLPTGIEEADEEDGIDDDTEIFEGNVGDIIPPGWHVQDISELKRKCQCCPADRDHRPQGYDYTELARFQFAQAPPTAENYAMACHQAEIRNKAKAEALAKRQGITLLPVRQSTIWSDEDTKDESQLEIQSQTSYTGIRPVLPSSLADQPCAVLGLTDLLDLFNKTLRTAYTESTPGVKDVLEACIARGDDFGIAFSRIRHFWYTDLTRVETIAERSQLRDTKMRISALDGKTNRIVKPAIPPRRIWDLFSNRVVPWWFLPNKSGVPNEAFVDRSELCAVSHSWMYDKLRRDVDTSINAHDWPVPTPVDTTLDRVRVELLNLGLQYAWLDVLCLRQAGNPDPDKEALRLEEWKLDVPMIGFIYVDLPQIVTYFGGLGRPFYLGNMDDERHWLNRAWTLQEASVISTCIVGGLVHDSPSPPPFDITEDTPIDPDVKQFYSRLNGMRSLRGQHIFKLMDVMRRRAATNELDKIAGLAYLFGSEILPAYIRTDDEASWELLMRTIMATYRGQLFFLYPAAGDGKHAWRPSWKQVKTTSLPDPAQSFITGIYQLIRYNEDDETYQCDGHLLRSCSVEGLAEPDVDDYCRRGVLRATSSDGTQHSFSVIAHHQHPIPDGEYALVASRGPSDLYRYWVVGRWVEPGAFLKVSVVTMVLGKDRRRLRELGAAEKMSVTLL
ncbi:hypothetical protein EIP86_007214 [Pleurotus ostreatoroseus]|nr:hypothetical protein EIP86_007214 [Pleurotus ostreatoroseus]